MLQRGERTNPNRDDLPRVLSDGSADRVRWIEHRKQPYERFDFTGHQLGQLFFRSTLEISGQAVDYPIDCVEGNRLSDKASTSKRDRLVTACQAVHEVLDQRKGGNLIDFVRQAGSMGFFNGDFEILFSLGAATEVLTALGDKMPEGLWVGTRYWFLAKDSAMNNKFSYNYFKNYGAYPSYNAHGAYSAVYAYKAAAEKAQSIEKMAIVNALEGLKLEIPTGMIEFRQGDHQAVTDAHWGKTAAKSTFSHRILQPIKIFKGQEITPAVSDTGCSM